MAAATTLPALSALIRRARSCWTNTTTSWPDCPTASDTRASLKTTLALLLLLLATSLQPAKARANTMAAPGQPTAPQPIKTAGAADLSMSLSRPSQSSERMPDRPPTSIGAREAEAEQRARRLPPATGAQKRDGPSYRKSTDAEVLTHRELELNCPCINGRFHHHRLHGLSRFFTLRRGSVCLPVDWESKLETHLPAQLGKFAVIGGTIRA